MKMYMVGDESMAEFYKYNIAVQNYSRAFILVLLYSSTKPFLHRRVRNGALPLISLIYASIAISQLCVKYNSLLCIRD